MENGTFIFITVLTLVICVMLVIIILSQNPKGGGLSSTFGGGGGQMFGVQRTNNFLDTATWTLSAIIALLIIVSSFTLPKNNQNLMPEIDLPAETIPAPDVNNSPNATPADAQIPVPTE